MFYQKKNSDIISMNSDILTEINSPPPDRESSRDSERAFKLLAPAFLRECVGRSPERGERFFSRARAPGLLPHDLEP